MRQSTNEVGQPEALGASATGRRRRSGRSKPANFDSRLRKIVLYLRYSSDLQRPESCDDQERTIRAGLRRMGIDDRDAVVLKDEAQSGTKADRTQFEILSGMIARGEVGILAVDDQARLSRGDDAAAFVKDLVYSGGRFISISEGIDTERSGWELQVKFKEVHNNSEIQATAHRVRRGQEGRVRADESAGDFPFGYESIYKDKNWTKLLEQRLRPHKLVRILQSEARWVRRIFFWYARRHWSLNKIARELTKRGVPPGRRGKNTAWRPGRVRAILDNPKYTGSWTWGETKTIRNSRGQKKQIPTPEDEHVHRDRPDLRIIDQETWDLAVARLKEYDEKYGSKPGQKRRGARPKAASDFPQNLLGGLVFCDHCGERMWVRGRTEARKLLCRNHEKGCCGMQTLVKFNDAEVALLNFLSELVNGWPEWIQRVVAGSRHTLEQLAQDKPLELAADQKSLNDLEQRIAKLLDALEDGEVESEEVRGRLKQRERDANILRARIRQAEAGVGQAIELPDEAAIRRELTDLVAIMRKGTPRAALLMQAIFGRVMARQVILPGRERGYVELHFRVRLWNAIWAARTKVANDYILGRLADAEQQDAASPEFVIPLGGPTEIDRWAATVVELRDQGIKWLEIRRRTGLPPTSARKAYERGLAARKIDSQSPDADSSAA